VNRILLLLLSVAFSTAQIDVLSAQEDEGLKYAFSSWSKQCFPGHYGIVTCFTRIDALSTCGIIGAVVTQQAAQKTTLAILLPPGARAKQDIRLTIDEESFSAPVAACPGPVCVAALDADDALIARMKAGRSLAVQWLVSADPPERHTFPLTGFAEAHESPMKQPTADQLRELKLQRQQALEERRKRGGC